MGFLEVLIIPKWLINDSRMVGCAEDSVEPPVGSFIRSGVVAINCCGHDWHGERFFWKRRMPIRLFSAKPSRWRMASTSCHHFSINHFRIDLLVFQECVGEDHHRDIIQNKWRDLSWNLAVKLPNFHLMFFWRHWSHIQDFQKILEHGWPELQEKLEQIARLSSQEAV